MPYNPTLLLRYKAHINVEICSSISSVKYLYKYCYKGHDRAIFSLQRDATESVDEIELYLDARYISACEAVWRILKFDTHARYPNVVRLPVHLEGMNAVYYNPDEAEDALANGKNTALTRYFEHVSRELLCPLPQETLQNNPSAFELYYHEFPKYYTWANNDWKRRSRPLKSNTVGRMYSAHPADMERFCLRMLLASTKGVPSYRHLRIWDGVEYSSYKEACLARGLLQSDDEFYKLMDEAASFRSPKQLRVLFSVILLFCNPVSPKELYAAFKLSLCEDFKYRFENAGIDANPEDYALLEISVELAHAGKTLQDFNLPVPREDVYNDHDFLDTLEESSPLSLEDIQSAISTMNTDQKKVFDTVANLLVNDQGGLIFVDAPGGTGKTYTFNTLLKWINLQYGEDVFLSTASSGVASLLLHRGRTVHSTFKVPLNVTSTSACQIDGKSVYARRLRKAKVIVWDEVYFFSCRAF